MPVLNEASGIDHSLQALLKTLQARWQVVVCDGGSEDATVERLAAYPVQVVTAQAGRAVQMNAGAGFAAGPLLVFLHGDTRLPNHFNQLMEAFLESDFEWGRFDVRLDNPRWPFRMIAWFMNQRSAITGVCTGDQTLFMRRDFFQRMGGYAELPLMEDVEFSLRARLQARPLRIQAPVVTSSRRWTKNGVVRTILLMWWLRLAYRLGVSPQRLQRWYYR